MYMYTHIAASLAFKEAWTPTSPTCPWWVYLVVAHHSTHGARGHLCSKKTGRQQWREGFAGGLGPSWAVGLKAPEIWYCIVKSCCKVTSKQSRGTVRCLSLQWTVEQEIINPVGSSRRCLEGKIPSTSTNILKIAKESRGWLNSYLHSILSRPTAEWKFPCNVCVWKSLQPCVHSTPLPFGICAGSLRLELI